MGRDLWLLVATRTGRPTPTHDQTVIRLKAEHMASMQQTQSDTAAASMCEFSEAFGRYRQKMLLSLQSTKQDCCWRVRTEHLANAGRAWHKAGPSVQSSNGSSYSSKTSCCRRLRAVPGIGLAELPSGNYWKNR